MSSREYDQYRQLMEKGRYAAAADFAEQQYLEGNRHNPFWLTRQSAALRRLKKFEKALTVSRQGLSLRPSDPYGIYETAQSLCGLRRFDEALSYFLEIADDNRLKNPARRGVLRCLAELKQWDRILETLARWNLPKESDFPWRVKALEGLNRLEEAVDACQQWLELQPDNRQGLWALTGLEIRRDGLEAVLKKMGKLAKIPSRPLIYKEIHASLCRRAGKSDLAVQQYEKMTHATAEPKVFRKQAFALAKSGRESEAIPMFEELLKLDPSNIYLHSGYIGACGRIHRLEKALSFYEELVEKNPDETHLYGRIKGIRNRLKAQPPKKEKQ